MIPLPPDAALCPLRPAMAQEIFRTVDANRFHLAHHLPWVPESKSAADTLAFIEGEVARREAGRSFPFAIYLHGQAVGINHLFTNKDRSEGEIGYWLALGAQGRGLVTRSTRILLALGRRELGLEVIRIRCHVDNPRSQAVPRRLGLPEVGREIDAAWAPEEREILIFEWRRGGEGARGEESPQGPGS